MASAMLYPLVFAPILKARVWGGRLLAGLASGPVPGDEPIGEAWEISDRPNDESVILNGTLAGRTLRWVIETQGEGLLGEATGVRGRFPLLIKLIEARQALSLQVHPPAACAAALGGEPKTELWYVVHAEAGAEVFAGFRSPLTRDDFAALLQTGAAAEAAHRIPVRAGDALFLPSGRMHALGAGCVIFEVQQNSDTTYRVFDWNRVGPDGQPRALHVAEALAGLDFDDVQPGLINTPWSNDGGGRRRTLVSGSPFEVEEWRLDESPVKPRGTHRPRVLGVVAGQVRIAHAPSGTEFDLRTGASCLIPAAVREITVVGKGATMLIATPNGGA